MPQLTLTKPKRFNSLDRRAARRVRRQAEFVTFGNDARFHRSAVIECTSAGARVVLTYPVEPGETIGVVVQSANARLRTFARVAWTAPLQGERSVAGLEFLKLEGDYSRAG